MDSQARVAPPATPSADLGFLSLLLAANLVALAPEVMTSALYPSLAAHLGLPLETVVLLTTPRALAQLGILLLAPLSERLGRARVLAGGLLLVAVGGWGGALARSLAAMVPTQLAFGLGFAIAMAGVPAIVGDRYRYAGRGRALGIVRLAMPIALIAVVPGLAVLGTRYGVAVPHALLGTVAFLLFLLVMWRLPRLVAQPPPSEAEEGGGRSWLRPQVILLLALTLALSAAPTAVFGFLSAWVTETFGNPARNLTLALTGDGLGALLGASLGALLIDRLTKRRAGILGLGLGGAFGLALALGQHSLGLGVAAIVGLAAALEVSLISLSALLTEAAPQARGTVMSLWAAALAAGAALSPLVARLLWLRGGMAAVAGASGALLLLLSAAFAVGVVEPGSRGCE